MEFPKTEQELDNAIEYMKSKGASNEEMRSIVTKFAQTQTSTPKAGLADSVKSTWDSKPQQETATAEGWAGKATDSFNKTAEARAAMQPIKEGLESNISKRWRQAGDISDSMEESDFGGTGIAGKIGRGMTEGVLKGLAVTEGAIEDVAEPVIGLGMKAVEKSLPLAKGLVKAGTKTAEYSPMGLGLKATNKVLGIDDEIEAGKEAVTGAVSDFAEAGTEKGKAALSELANWYRSQDEGVQAGMKALGFMGEGLLDLTGAGVATKAGKEVGLEGVEQAVKTVAKTATLPKQFADDVLPAIIKNADNIASSTKKGLKDTGMYAIIKTSGLNEDTVKTIAKNPEMFEQIQEGVISRETLFNDLMDTIKTAKMEVSEVGSGYDELKRLDIKIDIPVSGIDNLISNKGLQITDEGVSRVSSLSSKLSDTDINAVNEAYNLLKGTGQISPEEVLNLRSRLDDLVRWDSGVSKKGEAVVKDIRKAVDDVAKAKIPKLKELDETYAPMKRELDQLMSDYFKKDGTIRDNAASKLSNLTRKGREAVLGRLESKSPGISQKIESLVAMDDVMRAYGQHKTGLYTTGGLGIAGLASGNIPLALGSGLANVIGNPKIMANLIKKYGKLTKSEADEIAERIVKQAMTQGDEEVITKAITGKLTEAIK